MDKIWSRFNVDLELNDKLQIYNTYTNNLIEVEGKENIDAIYRIKENCFDDTDTEFVQELVNNNVLVDNDEIIIQKIKLARLNTRFRSDMMNLTLLPTLSCNFACPYCFEENAQEHTTMSKGTIEKIYKLVKQSKGLKYLNLEWYGGEPLLAFNIIKSLTSKIKKLNLEHLHTSIITNGYLLDKEKAHVIKELEVNMIQITIDGMENVHNQRRPHKSNKDSFTKIIGNLRFIGEIYPELSIFIRVNIDKNNSEEFFALNEFICNTINNPRVYVYPAYITEYTPCNATFCMLNRIEQADFALKNSDRYPFDQFYFPITAISECTARFQNSYVIGPKGEFYKCWSDVGMSEKITGNIDDGVTNSDLFTKYMSYSDPLFNEKCITCDCFPICNGGCVYKRLQNLEGVVNDDELCTIQKNKLEEFIKIFYNKNFANNSTKKE